MCVCVCVCVVCGTMDELLVSRAHNRKVVSSNLSPDMEKKNLSIYPVVDVHLPIPVYPAVMGTQHCWGANSLAIPHVSATGTGGTSGAHTHKL